MTILRPSVLLKVEETSGNECLGKVKEKAFLRDYCVAYNHITVTGITPAGLIFARKLKSVLDKSKKRKTKNKHLKVGDKLFFNDYKYGQIC